MKLPRDISGIELAKRLERLGYQITRQTGSHLRLTVDSPTKYHITIPMHDSLKVGTLAAILADVAAHEKMSRDDLIRELCR